MSMLDHAIGLAVRTHHGQRDIGGQPYILHPLHLMSKFDDLEYKVCAVLHDVVEDSLEMEDSTHTTIKTIKLLFSSKIATVLDLLTKKDGEKYDDYIERIATSENPIAIAVKIEDLKHNMQADRLPCKEQFFTEVTARRLMKYRLALFMLTEMIR